MKTTYFIGGPYDGRTVVLEDHFHTFEVHEHPPLNFEIPPSAMPHEPNIIGHTYVEARLHVSGRDVLFYIPHHIEDQYLYIMTELMTRYFGGVNFKKETWEPPLIPKMPQKTDIIESVLPPLAEDDKTSIFSEKLS